jgi:hypothetical protein
MGPPQEMKKKATKAVLKKGVVTRSQNPARPNSELLKRKAEGSSHEDKILKRSAFGDLTNVGTILPDSFENLSSNYEIAEFSINTKNYALI